MTFRYIIFLVLLVKDNVKIKILRCYCEIFKKTKFWNLTASEFKICSTQL